MPAITKLITNNERTMLFQLCDSSNSRSYDDSETNFCCFVFFFFNFHYVELQFHVQFNYHLPLLCLLDPELAVFRRVADAMIPRHLLHHHDLQPHAWHRPKEPMWLPCSPATLAFFYLSVSKHVSNT